MTRHSQRVPFFFLFLLAIAIFFVLPERQALAGCNFNVYVENTGSALIDVKNENSGGYHSSVKVKLGTWKDLRKGDWFYYEDDIALSPDEKRGDAYRGEFNCGAKRRYKVRYTCQEGKDRGKSFTEYFPSSTGWTKNQSLTVRLGRCR